jgi:hypothetical protein
VFQPPKNRTHVDDCQNRPRRRRYFPTDNPPSRRHYHLDLKLVLRIEVRFILQQEMSLLSYNRRLARNRKLRFYFSAPGRRIFGTKSCSQDGNTMLKCVDITGTLKSVAPPGPHRKCFVTTSKASWAPGPRLSVHIGLRGPWITKTTSLKTIFCH